MGYLGNNALPFDPIRSSGRPRDAQRFSGNGSTTTFTLNFSVFAPTDLEVFVENVQQEPLFSYDAIGNQLIFTEAPPSGTNNIYVVYKNVEAGIYNQIPDGSISYQKLANNIRVFTTDNYTGDNATTSFALTERPADANTLFVSIDGVVQRAPIHYTVSNTTITFASAPPSSSNVHVRHLGFRTTSTITALAANTTISQPILQSPTITNPTITGGTLTNSTAVGLVANNTNLFVENTYLRGNYYHTSVATFTNGSDATHMGVANTNYFVINSGNGPENLNSARYQALGIAPNFDTFDNLSNQPSFRIASVSDTVGDSPLSTFTYSSFPGLVLGSTSASTANNLIRPAEMFYQTRYFSPTGAALPIIQWVMLNYSGIKSDNNVYSILNRSNSHAGVITIFQNNTGSTTHIPFYSTGGAGVAYYWTILDPDTGWLYNQSGPSFSFTDRGTSPNTYTVAGSNGSGQWTVQRTSGTQSYQVWFHIALFGPSFGNT